MLVAVLAASEVKMSVCSNGRGLYAAAEAESSMPRVMLLCSMFRLSATWTRSPRPSAPPAVVADQNMLDVGSPTTPISPTTIGGRGSLTLRRW
jgi:hypothetical protein